MSERVLETGAGVVALSDASFVVPDHLPASGWTQHAPFAFWLTEALRPRVFVELGTHSGLSYFAFCQAVDRCGAPTQCFGIDTWQGDEHAGFYGDEVWQQVSAHNAARYAGFSTLLRGTFTEAVGRFEDGTIDLLHVDGRHFYDDVRHDFEEWRPKLAPDAVVLFHDTAVRERGFGVYRLWNELREQHRGFEFLHGNGLGVLALGPAVPPRLTALLAASDDPAATATVRRAYARLGQALNDRSEVARLGPESAARHREIERRDGELSAHLDEIGRLEGQLAAGREAIERLGTELAEGRTEVDRLGLELDGRQAACGELTDQLADARAAAEALRLRGEAVADEMQGLRREVSASERRAEELARALSAAQDETEAREAIVQAMHRTVRDVRDAADRAVQGEALDFRGREAVLRRELEDARHRHALVLNSNSFRALGPLRRLAERFPRARRALVPWLRVIWWTVSLKFRLIADLLRARRHRREDLRLIDRSGLFDARFYAASVPSVAPFTPLEHYVRVGGPEGRRPHPLFDAAWYLDEYPAVREAGGNPLADYLRHGVAAGRNPNPYFDTLWYIARAGGDPAAGANPLRHYIEVGAPGGINPSPIFDAPWYAGHYPDVTDQGVPALEHFLLCGKSEGRAPSGAVGGSVTSGRPVTDAEIHCLKPVRPGGETALFVSHSPHGRLKPHVRHYLDALRREGIGVVLIVAADVPFTDADPALLDGLAGMFVRRNEGLDFAAWTHVLDIEPRLFDADILYLVNDSLIGPVDQDAFARVIGRVRESSAGLVGLCDSEERGWHIQSFFLALKPGALSSYALHRFFGRVVSLQDKQEVINRYEVRFAPDLREAGVRCEALFPSYSGMNRTIFDWRALLLSGFPFVKVMTLRDRFPDVDTEGWQALLTEQGFDASIAERTLAEARMPVAPAPAGTRAPLWRPTVPAAPRTPPRVAFIGPWNYDNGLGVGARGFVSALWHAGMPFNAHPVRRPFHIHRSVAPMIDVASFAGPADVAIVNLNPDAWPGLLTDAQKAIIRGAHRSVGHWVWEMGHIPPDWNRAIEAVDAIWAPSRYCADVFAAGSGKPVAVVPYVVPVEPRAADPVLRSAMLREVEVAADQRIILYAFDGASYLVRKNPFALVRAFGRSGLGAKGWTLVLKTKNLFDREAEGHRLVNDVASTPGVRLIDRALDRATMGELMGAADIYASTHCAEGFGLTIAEAMALGKAVVATDYSGSRDFVEAGSAYPVRCRVRTLQEDHGHYTRGGVWAEVDENHLVGALREAADRIMAGDRGVGERARRLIAERLSPEAVGRAMRDGVHRVLEA